MTEIDPVEWPAAPLPACGDRQIEADFDNLPVDLILDQAMGYSQYAFFAVNDLEVPDVFTDWQPEAIRDAIYALTDQLRDALPEDSRYVGELACARSLELLDTIHHGVAIHLFKLGYLFGKKQAGWERINVYAAAKNSGGRK